MKAKILAPVATVLVVLAGAGFFWSQAGRLQGEDVLSAAEKCPVSPITTERPENANTAAWSRTWYRSPDGRIWASEPGLRRQRFEGDKTVGDKVLWVKPVGSKLHVEGRRLDGKAPPLEVSMPCCYPEDFQASGVQFPTPGCWEIEASAESTEWRFVVYIQPPR